MASELLKLPKRVIDLALSAGRKRQSPRTGFVHDVPDTIPLYENFCFALTLFHHKTTESVLEGKALLERLLAFQTGEGNFPSYLHDFPRCWDDSMSLRIAPLLVQIERRFGSVLGTEMKEKILAAVALSIRFASRKQWSPMWEQRYLALRQETADFTPASAEEWFERLISAQLLGEDIGNIPYHQGLAAFIGGEESQEQGEPTPWPIEWILAEKEGFSERLLRDHLAALRAAAAFPIETPALSSDPYAFIAGSGGVRWLWGNRKLHSLSVPNGRLEGNRILENSANSVGPRDRARLPGGPQKCSVFGERHCKIEASAASDSTERPIPEHAAPGSPETHRFWGGALGSEENRFGTAVAGPGRQLIRPQSGRTDEQGQILFSLADPAEPGRGDLIEAALFCDLSPETEVLIEGRRGMVFHLGDRVEIRTPTMTFICQFHLIDGSGDFLGQISRGNRPAQTACKGSFRYEAFDWQIAIRTLRRSPGCRLALAVCYEIAAGAEGEGSADLRCKAALSIARPIACMPLST